MNELVLANRAADWRRLKMLVPTRLRTPLRDLGLEHHSNLQVNAQSPETWILRPVTGGKRSPSLIK
jgi:hypothetical protein